MGRTFKIVDWTHSHQWLVLARAFSVTEVCGGMAMTIIRKGTYTVNYQETGDKRQFSSLRAALDVAAAHVGNHSFAKPWPEEDTYFYGPGDGTTSVIVREDIEFAA